MIDFSYLRKYRRFFPHVNRVVRLLTFSDLLVLSGLGLASPVFAVFLTDQIRGGNLETVGFALTIYLLVKSLLQIPVAEYIDHKKGEGDDWKLMFWGSLLIAFSQFFYLFARLPLHIYLIQILVGIGGALSYPSWLAIFTRHIDKNEEGLEWSIYYTLTDIGGAVTAAVGGIIAQNLGFAPLFLTVGTLTMLGAFALLGIRRNLS